MLFYIFIFLTLFTCQMKANLVVIECTFPCPNEDVCEVSNYFIKCKQRTNKTKWILKDTSLPEYQGTPIELGEQCIFAPHPRLKDASHLSTNTSESIMDWPPAYDQFYSNCKQNAYCNSLNICVEQLNHGEICESDNHCLNGICIQNTCQANHSKTSDKRGLNTVHIILTVVGVVLFLSLLFGIYMIRRRKRIKYELEKETHHIIKPTTTTTTSSVSSTTENTNAVTNILHPNYDPQNNSSTTPSRQQQELQLQLQRQLPQNSHLPPPPPPPPYSP